MLTSSATVPFGATAVSGLFLSIFLPPSSIPPSFFLFVILDSLQGTQKFCLVVARRRHLDQAIWQPVLIHIFCTFALSPPWKPGLLFVSTRRWLHWHAHGRPQNNNEHELQKERSRNQENVESSPLNYYLRPNAFLLDIIFPLLGQIGGGIKKESHEKCRAHFDSTSLHFSFTSTSLQSRIDSMIDFSVMSIPRSILIRFGPAHILLNPSDDA